MFLSGEKFPNNARACRFVNRLGSPPANRTDHQSDGGVNNNCENVDPSNGMPYRAFWLSRKSSFRFPLRPPEHLSWPAFCRMSRNLPSLYWEGRFVYFQKTNYTGLCSLSPFTAMRHCVLSNLLDEKRDSGRCRPVAGPVDRDERDRVIASLGNVYHGTITGSGVV